MIQHCKSGNIIYYIRKVKTTSSSHYAEKAFNKILYPFFMKKAMERLGMQGTYFSIIIANYNKPTASINLNRKNIRHFL